ncbi:MAG TPA: hypothetical protein VGL55_05555 [Steroidobacteraceae bacterium]|jgi:hypothetical protein
MNAVHTPSRTRTSSAGAATGADADPTKSEISGSQPGSSYVVQLALSGAAIDPVAIPHLDIFDVYRLYSKIAVADGVARHAIRLGFFKEARIARTVARYLGAYFESPTIVQVGASEEARAANHLLVALKDIGASGRHAVIELSTPRAMPTQARVAESKPSGRYAARTSLWLRLINSLHL